MKITWGGAGSSETSSASASASALLRFLSSYSASIPRHPAPSQLLMRMNQFKDLMRMTMNKFKEIRTWDGGKASVLGEPRCHGGGVEVAVDAGDRSLQVPGARR